LVICLAFSVCGRPQQQQEDSKISLQMVDTYHWSCICQVKVLFSIGNTAAVRSK